MNIIIMLDEGLLGNPMCPPLSVGCSVMEMKVDTLTDNVSIGLQNREDSAQQIKRYLLGWTCGCVTAWINLCVCVLLNCAGHDDVLLDHPACASLLCLVQFDGAKS